MVHTRLLAWMKSISIRLTQCTKMTGSRTVVAETLRRRADLYVSQYTDSLTILLDDY